MASSDADPVGRVLEACGLVLERARLLGSRRPIVVAVSGGADSLCLLDAMVTLLVRAKRRIVVGHVDHMLRPGSLADSEYVRAVAGSYDLTFKVYTVSVSELATHDRRGIEETARIARYRALASADLSPGLPVVATGHTRDDSIETVLLHFLRGTGRRGLGGICDDEVLTIPEIDWPAWPSPRTEVRVIRPLLDLGRADTVAYCEARGIRWLTDVTNADPRFARNRVRGHLLPVLRTYNPSVDKALIRMAETMRDEDSWLHAIASGRLHRLLRAADDGAALDIAGWRRQPLPLQRRMVRLIAASLGHDEIGFEAVERALAVGSGSGPPRAELGGDVTVERRRDTLFFKRSQRKLNE